MTPAMRVVEEVAATTGVPSREILGKSRMAHIVKARREAIRRLYLDRRMNTPALSALFGMPPNNVRHHLRAVGIFGCRSRMEKPG